MAFPDWAPLRGGATAIGCFLSSGSALNTELVSRAGFDFILIDLEHGLGSERDVLGQMQALAGSPVAGIVRVESPQLPRVHRVLDLGAHGVMFPRINSGAQAREAIASMRYPPEGSRGVAVLVRASDYGAQFTEYRDQQKTNLLSVIQIETAEAVANVDEIAAVEGVDVLFIGPMDLTTSLGVFRQYDHPVYLQALEKTLAAAARHGRTPGILITRPEDAAHYRKLGFRFLTCGTDTGFLLNAARATAAAMRAAL